MGAPRNPLSVRSRIRVALVQLGIFAAVADLMEHAQANGPKLTRKERGHFAVQVSQVRNEILAAKGVKVKAGQFGPLGHAERAKLAAQFKANTKGVRKTRLLAEV